MMKLVLRSLVFYWRSNLSVLGGTALACGVLTGALLVGDSVDYSLRTFATTRLGDIHYAMDTRTQFVREDLATNLGRALDTEIATAVHLKGVAIHQAESGQERKQVNKVQVFGVDAGFWSFGDRPELTLAPFETAISTNLAASLEVAEGDEISIRVVKPSLMARDSPLSWRDEDSSRRMRCRVKHVLTDAEMGRFGLAASQAAPHNAYLDRSFLQQQVELEKRVNLVLTGAGSDLDGMNGALKAAWEPGNIGLDIRAHASGVAQVESDRIFLGPETVRAAEAISDAEGTLTYLVSTLGNQERLTPYFFIVAGPVPGDMRDDQIVINRWVADELDAKVGDSLTLTYVELMSNNDFSERVREFEVHSIREMADLQTERELMPIFPGLSDVDSCSDWDVGMPMDDELLEDEANEEYWQKYRATPKAFVTLAAGQEMWANRFGNLTAVRYSDGAANIDRLRIALKEEMDPGKTGLFFQPVREQALAAVSEAMDFGGLFLGMSFFLIVSAMMLTVLLFVFGVEQRGTQIGTLLAVGYPLSVVRRLLLWEGLFIALVGVIAGSALGTLYTRILISGLERYWGGAVANTTILYHATATTIVIGGAATFVFASVAMVRAIRRLTRKPGRELLSGLAAQGDAAAQPTPPKSRGLIISVAAAAVSGLLVVLALVLNVANVAPIFFGAGALLLMSGIGLFRHFILGLNRTDSAQSFNLNSLALLNLSRRPGRSLTVTGLLASACFLVFAVSSMQEDLAAHAHARSSGTGGFALVADSTFPLLENPVQALDDANVSASAIKVRDGDDASCLNLNHAQSPRVLGVNVDELIQRNAFDPEGQEESVWDMLKLDLPDGAIPALIGDANTATWTLKKKAGIKNGDVLIYKDEAGNEVKLKLVGQLPMRLSVFQGSLLISQEAFTQLYPSEDGHRMFLIDAPPEQVLTVAGALSRRYERAGLDAVPAVQRLMEFYAVESTYLAMFLVLGGFGLAIGILGMAVVILRNLFERRNELAMLKALGFSKGKMARVIFTEYGFLVAVGLAIGGVAALIAMLPAHFATQPTVAGGAQALIAGLVLLTSAGAMIVAVWAGIRRVQLSALREE